MHKVMINVSFSEDDAARIDRFRAEAPDRDEMKRAAWVRWATRRFMATLTEPAPRSSPKPRNVARPILGQVEAARLAASRERDEAHEGARLRAAREAAGLTQPELATAISSESVAVSRNQIHRAERAASLEQWPALRAWLLEREGVKS